MKNRMLVMMVGLPGSGKSTLAANFIAVGALAPLPEEYQQFEYVSTDHYIDEAAKLHCKTYNDVFKDEIKSATKAMNDSVKQIVSEKKNLVWDQTNLTIITRKKKLDFFNNIPNSELYHKIAMFVDTDSRTCLERIENRPGKNIPENIMISMIHSIQTPTVTEGFDEIVFV